MTMTEPQVVDPIVVEQRIAGGGAQIEIVVPENLRYFDGHFPGAPVVPGVVQIKWAIELARMSLGVGGGFAGMEAVKFNQAMTPGTRATLGLEYAPGERKLRFAFGSGAVRYSSGRVLLRGGP
jgi:3-hydroxymyristoyl/3-hydroxydecanoyl-(acyl carrier protein) dehydratase